MYTGASTRLILVWFELYVLWVDDLLFCNGLIIRPNNEEI